MDDYKIFIYIALSILYFLFKKSGKKKKKADSTHTEPQAAQSRPSEKQRAKSFEEILAELSGTNQEREEETGRKGSETLAEKEEIRSLSEQVEERPIHQSTDPEDYENADETLKELYRKGERIKSIDELVNIDEVAAQRTEGEEEFEEAEHDDSFAHEIREGLSNSDNAKKAIIYAEIFNRKY